jgi:hypothetical protein
VIRQVLWVTGLLAVALDASAAPAPDWAASVVGTYVGREWNAGEMQCERTDFSLRDGALVGHYWIDDAHPFEGELTSFVPDGGSSGTFIWTDRYGTGVRYIRFAGDRTSFWSMWGLEEPDTGKPGYGLRGEGASVPGCGAPPVS